MPLHMDQTPLLVHDLLLIVHVRGLNWDGQRPLGPREMGAPGFRTAMQYTEGTEKGPVGTEEGGERGRCGFSTRRAQRSRRDAEEKEKE